MNFHQMTLGEQVAILDELMFCFTSQRTIERLIDLRDEKEEAIASFLRYF